MANFEAVAHAACELFKENHFVTAAAAADIIKIQRDRVSLRNEGSVGVKAYDIDLPW